jgi:hypothetical protein
MKTRFPVKALVLALLVAGMGTAAAADTTDQTLTTQSATMDQLTTTQEPSRVTTKFASDFAAFVGSQDDAEAIITGLRTGTPITLSGTTTITPPTRPMGYGETYISMSLAKAQLAQYGITEPTPEQLQAAMTGGTITVITVGANGATTTQTVTLDGILTQRASGMGWGQIANANGFKLGQVISSMKSANKSLASTRAGTATGSAAASSHTVQGKATTHAGKGGSHGGRYASTDRGITSALGGGGIVYGKEHARSGTQVASLNSHGGGEVARGGGAGIATAAGGAAAIHGNAGGDSGNAGAHGRGPK